MSRLSLKPGGEPGTWEVVLQAGENGVPFTYVCPDVSDEALMDIRSTLSEYLDAKYEVCSGAPVGVKPNGIYDPLGLLVPHWKRWSSRLAWVFVGCMISMVGFWYGWSRVPAIPPSTGGVIDQLCMRPDIECSTSIRYVHPQKSGVVEQGDPVPQIECIAVDPQGNYHPEPCSKSEEQ